VSGSPPRSRAALAVVLGVFFASGFAALLYQVVWQRLLALFSGADVFSVTIVVSAFMTGLGVGSWAGGHLADRLGERRCLLGFAAAELAIALFALVSKFLYYDLLYVQLGALDVSLPALAVLLFLAVVWPTFFMGVSLPLLARGMTSTLDGAARMVGSLYGWNTIGAAAGAFGTSWLLLRRFDFETCLWIGAGINFACAAAALALVRLRGASGAAVARASAPPSPGAPEAAAGAPLLSLPGWLLVYALSGATALSLEIVWFRMLGVMLKSTSFTFGTLLGIYLLGVGSGSVIGARLVGPGGRDPAARFLTLQAAIPLYAALSASLLVLAVGRASALDPLWRFFATTEPLRLAPVLLALGRDPLGLLFQETPLAQSARLFLLLYGVVPLLLIGPPTFLMGLSFPYLQRAVQTDARFLGRRVGWLQTANIAGSLVGSSATGFLLLPAIGVPGALRALALVAVVFAALRLRATPRVRRVGPRLAGVGVAAAALLAVALIPASPVFWARLHGVRADRILEAEDASGLSLIRPLRGDGHVVMAGGLGLSEFPFGAYEGVHTLLGALPVLIHPSPRRVAVIGLGSGDTSYAAAAAPEVEEVVTVEIIGSQLDVLRRFQALRPYDALGRLFDGPRFRFVVGDGRTHVRRDPEKYDVIEADALRPSSAYAGNLYSLEYFALLRERLRPGGLAVSWLPTPRTRDTFVRSFPHVLVLGNLALGSESPIDFDPAALLARCEEPAVRAHFAAAGVDLRRLVAERLASSPVERIGPEADRTALRDVNSDLHPKDEFLIGGKSW
jgi:predicted membrane-bound spermidine synthase